MRDDAFATVRDRAILALKRRLLRIQEQDGYAFSVTGVHRRGVAPAFGSALPEIALFFGQASHRFVNESEDKIHDELATQIRFAADGVDDDTVPADRGFDLFVADIQRCLRPSDPIRDPWYSRARIELDPRGNRIFYSPGVPRIAGVVFYLIRYSYKASDPRLWPGETNHVSLEQAQAIEDTPG